MLTQARLKELLAYDPTTGEFTNLKSGRGRKPVGTVVGSPNNTGYTTSMIGGKNYLHHRLAWLYTHSVFPPTDLDHRDGVRTNNALQNLRPATRAENCQNAATRNDNRSGSPGVRRVGARWRARLSVRGVHHHLGYFPDWQSAEAARLRAKREHHEFQPTPRHSL